MIQLAEKRLQRDRRIRQTSYRSFTAAEGYTLPDDFNGLIDLYHDGASQFGRIKLVSPSELSERKLRHGDTGVPRWVAVIDEADSQSLYFAPEPSGTYTLKMKYEAEIEHLSATIPTNWLLAQAPDLYLWACLSVAEGFLQEDSRVQLWKSEYEQAADEFERNKKRREYSGPLTPRPANIIGEDVPYVGD
jgi:hypothetical protein